MHKILNTIKEIFSEYAAKITDSSVSDQRVNQLILYLIILLLVNMAGTTLNYRIDLTRGGVYSLSDKSREIVSNLKENLKIKVLFSEDLPAEHQRAYRYLIDILNEYDYHGNRYFSYEIISQADLEAEASAYGINPVSSRELASDQVRFRKTYMGIVIHHADLIEKIEALTTPAGLEYEISSLIIKMSSKITALNNLKNPVYVTLYLDSSLKQLPIEGVADFHKEVEKAVEQANIHHYNKIKFRYLDSSSSGGPESLASAYGLKRLIWAGGKTPGGGTINPGEGVIGILVEADGRFTTISLNVGATLLGGYTITGVDRLDDRISSAIGSLLSVNTRVGYLTGHGEADIYDERSPDGAGVLRQIVSETYDFQVINTAEEDIPDDIGTLIINGPKLPLTDYELYKIDQYLMRGGNAIFFVDSFLDLSNQGQQNMMQGQPGVVPINTGLEKLLAHYGVRVNKDLVLDTSCAQVDLGNVIKDFPMVPVIHRGTLDQESVITANMSGFVFLKGSSITIDENTIAGSGVRARRLINSSGKSWLMKENINFNPYMMEPPPESEMNSYTLGVLLSGTFKSYYKDKDIPARENAAAVFTAERLNATPSTAQTGIIVVSSSEITKSRFIIESQKIISQGGYGSPGLIANVVLLQNMIDYAAGNNYSPQMRTKNLAYNPIKPFEEKTRFIMKSVNIAGVPLMMILLGAVVWHRRKIRRKMIQTMFSTEGK